jgi:subtilisin family serine protease
MKKRIFFLVITLAFLLPFIAIPARGSDFRAFFTADFVRAELASAFDASNMEANGLSEALPFWVDMVDTEGLDEDGSGVYVAVLDTGLLDPWPFFFSQANIASHLGKGFTHDVYWDDTIQDFVFGDLRDDRGFITDSFMGSGHGTHVTSTIVGYQYSTSTENFWVRGVAPGATIIPVLVLDAWLVDYPGGQAAFTGGTDEMVSAGIYYVADLSEGLDGPVIISMSLGGPTPAPMIEDAINYAIDKGVIVVASAGNNGYDGMGWPGAYDQVISCAMGGWTEQWIGYPDRWWLYDVTENLKSEDAWGNNHQIFLDYGSSRPNKALGQKSFHLDVTAPGCAIVGPYKSYFSYYIGYYYLWGTSMAAPHVSAISSLLLENNPEISQAKMEKTFKIAASGLPLASDGALAYDVPGWPYYFTWYGTNYGSGFLQADAAFKALK